MTLDAGRRVGQYEVVGPLGAGGMGEVYRAHDTKLNRDVALKVLLETFASDPQRMARFEREAQVLASLNHPNLAAIYGLEDSGGVRALAMELVEGPTLAERLKTGGIPLEEALPIAEQIAEGLEYAHERGIVHRDLKPANIKITPEGTVKVLDFGLAKALDVTAASLSTGSEQAAQNSPTLTMAATQAGIIIGTAAYMSPEQAKGKAVDRRADIWAFGCVLHEILTGRPVFYGETPSDILAAVIKEEPDWSALPSDTPPAIDRLIRRCITKDPKRRLRDIGEARIAIEETLASIAARGHATAHVRAIRELPLPTKTEQSAGHRSSRALPWALASVMGLALLVVLYPYWRATHASQSPVVELSLAIPSPQQLMIADGPGIVISPDGSRIAYVVQTSPDRDQIYIREIGKSQAAPLEGAEGTAPFFSPDGRWLGFYSGDGKLEKTSVFGGAPVVLCTADSHRGAWWGENGTIIFPSSVTTGLYQISSSGGVPVAVTHLDAGKSEITHRWPQILPDGNTVLFTASSDNNDFGHAEVEAASLSTGQAKVLVENAYFGRYLPSGYLTYISGGTLFAAPFDAKALKLTGPSMPVLQNIQSDLTNGSAQLSFSEAGTAIYLTGQGLNSQDTVVLVDRKGVTTPLIKQPGNYLAPRFSPDGKRLAVEEGIGNVWVYDLARATMTPVTFPPGDCVVPVWRPDGKQITCARLSAAGAGSGMSWIPADGTGSLEPLTEAGKRRQIPFSWSPDGQTLAFAQYAQFGGGCCEIWTLPMSASGQPGEPKSFLATQGELYAPAFSPDGHWLAYQTLVSGVAQVFVVPYPGPGGRWQASVSSGEFPRWSRTKHELFFDVGGRSGVALAVVPYSVQGGKFVPGEPTVLFHSRFLQTDPIPYYDVAPDGKHFAVLEPVGRNESASAPPTVVLNWFARVQRLVTAGEK